MSRAARRLKAAVIGKDARTAAVRRCLAASRRVDGDPIVLSFGKGAASVDEAIEQARRHRPDFVVVGPEEPLDRGVVDRLQGELGIPCVGPTRALAQLESSKAFTRRLLAESGIPGNPTFEVFESIDGIADYIGRLGDFVIKPDGLTGGKGVKVSGVHLHSIAEALEYCKETFASGQPRIAVEEKLDGEEFSLQSFCDGTHVLHMPPVQDHKRAYDGDSGPNTGGMGSYSDADHLLPFIDRETLAAAQAINERIPAALYAKLGAKYKGILFGGFMATKDGVRLLEYNARFGDPESLNVLSLLESDFGEICEAIVDERLRELAVAFQKRATVCKYIVPSGYPTKPVVGGRIEAVPSESSSLKVYPAAVDEAPDGSLVMSGSRALALVGIGDDLDAASAIAEAAAASVRGPVFYRKDIGTRALVERRVAHMRELRNRSASSYSPISSPTVLKSST